jgi:hypothetical protein
LNAIEGVAQRHLAGLALKQLTSFFSSTLDRTASVAIGLQTNELATLLFQCGLKFTQINIWSLRDPGQ